MMVATAATVSAGPTTAGAVPLSNCALGSGFGRMFPALPSASFAFDDLQRLSEATIEQTHFEPTVKSKLDDEMDKFPAGYTYTGQFIDHDIVLDPRPNDLLTPVNPSTLTNNRTPQLDLDSVYAGGPSGSPNLYEADGVHLRLGAPLSGASSDPGARDLLRGADGQALVGDGRNDENRIVGSLHSILTRFHNKVADQVRTDHPSWSNGQVFAAARQQVTWHYQWAVLTDFLPTVAGDAETNKVVKHAASGRTTSLQFYNSCTTPMPVEFSVAAYRFGHSMVRNDYVLNDAIRDIPVFTASFNPTESLVGFGPAPSNFATDWKFFFNMEKTTTPQNAYQIDNSALRLIPGPAAGTASTILSTRNLLRGQQLGLPSGQDVARAMGIVRCPTTRS
jgi:Animal haem peroxidase